MKSAAKNLRSSVANLSVTNVKAVAFDAYGTLFDFQEPDFIVTFAEICSLQGLEADAADLWRRFLRAARHFRAENHHDPVYSRYDEAWAVQFERVFKQLGLVGDEWAAAEYRARTTVWPSSPTPTTTS
jgi:FMN phosphatase YigB (HAD superfamily)